MNKERKTMKAITLTLCLFLLLGAFAFGNPQAAYGWTPPQDLDLMEIISDATVNSSWGESGKYDSSFYDEIKKNYADSYGSKGDPLKITSAEQLAAFAKVVNETGTSTYNFQGKYVELASDINLNGGKFSMGPYDTSAVDSIYKIKISGNCDNVWQPIGIDPDHPFQGTFDGKGHEIEGMVVLNELTEANVYSGFFGVLAKGGTIQNLSISDGNVLSAVYYSAEYKKDGFSAYAGGLVGQNNGSITNSDSTGDVASITKRAKSYIAPPSSAYAGGLVGWNGKTGSITESHGIGTAMSYSFSPNRGNSNAGGLAGWNEGKITKSYSMGDILTSGNAPNHAGGLVGTNDEGAEIETSYSTRAMITSYNYTPFLSIAGGLVGENKGSITKSYSTGSVKSSARSNSAYAGGLVGLNEENGSIAESCSTGATTSVSESPSDYNPVYAGGLAGWNRGVITASYSTGEVRSSAKKSSAYAGGLVGRNGESGSITASYTTGVARSVADASASLPVFVGGLVGLNDKNAGLVENNYRDNTVKLTAKGGSEQRTEKAGTPLDPRKMTGRGPGRAETTMDGLDGGTWEFQKDNAITGPDGEGKYSQTWHYPRLTAIAITYTDSPKPKYIKTGLRLSDDISKLEITGEPKAGQTLTAKVTGTNLIGLQYQWYVEGVGNKGNGETYVVEEKDAGKKVIATVYKEERLGTLEDSVKISCSVEINNPAGSHIKRISGSASQNSITGAMEDVVYEAEQGYYFPEDYTVDAVNGIQVKRNSYTEITASGTPTANTSITLKPAAKKADQSAPPGISDGVNKIKGTDKNMEYANSPGALNWITCNEGATAVAPGTWYVRYKETDTQKASSAVAVTVTTTYQVEITNPSGSHITRSSGEEKQTVNSARAMEPVVYEADSGYYFPEDYSISPENGVQVKRDSYTKITVSGKPTASASLTLKPAAKKADQSAPSGLKNGENRILGTTAAMEYAASSNAVKWNACKNGSTAVKAGTWFVRYKETATKKAGAAAKITVAPIAPKAPKAPKIKATTTYNSARISWKKVSGAAGYQVYRAGSKNGKYKKVKTIKQTSWTNKKLTTGKTYYYKVRAYKKSGSKTLYGNFSNKVKAVPRTKAPIFKLTAGNNKMRISWNKVSGADGYRIYRAKSKKGRYKMIKDSRSRLRRYTSIRLTDKHRYYYKMRSYKVVKGKKVYSVYSKVKSKRTR